MAIFHLSVKVIGRNQGRSAVAAAAYRGAEKIENEWDGVTHDFARKNWVVYSEILLPEYAPKEYCNRATLWNAVEKSEKASDARLAREVEIALPKELSQDEQIHILREFVQKKFISEGMIADINIHNPPKTDDKGRALDVYGNITTDIERMVFQNPHAHILLTVRPLDANGAWQAKTQKEYLLLKDGEEKAFLATEVSKAEAEGWEKQYSYRCGKRKEWLTKSQAAEKGLEQVNRTPKATRFGRQNPITEHWNSKDRIFEWRNSWAAMCNQAFIKKDMDERIDARSFAEQGRMDELPTIHKGVDANNFDKRVRREGGKTFSKIGQYNELIKEHNRLIRKMKKAIKAIESKVSDVAIGIKKSLEDLRIKLIGTEYQMRKIAELIKPTAKEEYFRIKAYMDKRKELENKIAVSKDQLAVLRNQLSKTSFMAIKEKNHIKQEIAKEQELIETAEEVITSTAVRYGIDEMTYKERFKEISYIGKQIEIEELLKSEKYKDKVAFKEQYKQMSKEEQVVFAETNAYRQAAEVKLKAEISDTIEMDKSIEAIDKELGIRGKSLRKTVKMRM